MPEPRQRTTSPNGQRVPAAEAAALFDHFDPGTLVPARVKRMVEASHDTPWWDLATARKDARLMQEAAAAAGVELVALPGIAARMDAALAAGNADKDWTAIARSALR